MNKLEFKEKHLNNAFYWINRGNFERLQEIAIECGLTWHTGDTDVLPFDKYNLKNLVMFDGYFQSVPFYSPAHSYGDPKDFDEMLEAYLKTLNQGKPNESRD
jgi:hypothetical protein